MGGYGSGRRSGARPTTDGARALDVRLLARSGRLAPVAHAFRWPSVWGDAAIAFTVDDDGDGLTLDYQTRGSYWEEPRPVRQAVRLERTPCRLGGERPWFACPACGRRVAALYFLSAVCDHFRCRHCLGLAYASTREDAGRRLVRKADRLRADLGGAPGFGARPPRPAGKGWQAYWRRVERIEALDAAYAARVAPAVEALSARLRGMEP